MVTGPRRPNMADSKGLEKVVSSSEDGERYYRLGNFGRDVEERDSWFFHERGARIWKRSDFEGSVLRFFFENRGGLGDLEDYGFGV